MIKKKIIIATGGTGGHVFPAYSLANYLKNKDYKVIITSDSRGSKYLKNYGNLDLRKIPSSPLIKTDFFKFFLSSLIIFFSIIRSFFFLLFNRPSIIVGMGGYSSFPVCIAASILKIKFVIYENNLIIGKANKYLLPFTKKIFVSYSDLEGISEKYKHKVFEIGNVVRKEILDFKFPDTYQNKLAVLNILVLGGSQAAKIFGDELPEIFIKLKNSDIPIKVFQQCQRGQNKRISDIYQKHNIDHEIFNFTDKIINYYTKVNLVITRSGASVLGELINLKIPFISIPLPSSADNHQYKNAEFYKKKNCGYLINEKDINYKLFDLILSLFKDKSLFVNILSNQKQYSDKNIFKNLGIQLEKILNEKN